MKNWIELDNAEYRKIWDKIYNEFNFEPSMTNFPSFSPPVPFITYDISSIWGASNHDELYFNLEAKFLESFQTLTNPNEYFYALDWQHDCYWINAFLDFPKDDLDRWLIPAVPDGDYYFFIHNDFKWGILSHPWEKTITIFGKELIEKILNNKPAIFHSILRKG
jgi:hypothetical protein